MNIRAFVGVLIK